MQPFHRSLNLLTCSPGRALALCSACVLFLGATTALLAAGGVLSGSRSYDLKWADVNDLEMAVSNQGSFAYDFYTGNAGLIYPNGTTQTAVFAAGIWLGAYVGSDLRVSVAEYANSYSPGPILSPDNPADPQSPYYHLFKINQGDTPQSNPDYDLWMHWPAGLPGAPPLVNGLPRLLGDQTLWSVYNDIYLPRPQTPPASLLGLGVQVRHTTFALARQGDARIIFLEFEIQNVSLNVLQDAYVSIWLDPDLGGAIDDLVGCDTLRQVGYCYNGDNDDQVYGSQPPAAGLVLLQGPIVPDPDSTAWVNGTPVPGYRNLPMTSFQKYISGTDPSNPVTAYNYMRGLMADGSPMVDPTSGRITTYACPGDPVQGTGWVDANPTDKRMMITSGPIQMEPNATQMVSAAILMGQGPDRLASITDLRALTARARSTFDEIFTNPPTPVSLAAFQAQPAEGGIRLTWRLPEGAGLTSVALERDCGSGWTAASEDLPADQREGSYLDAGADAGALCRYRIFGTGREGERIDLGETEVASPADGVRFFCRRNPVRGETVFEWRLPEAGATRLELFDAAGRLLRVLYAGAAAAGSGSVAWDGRDAGAQRVNGAIFARLSSGREVRTIRLVSLH